MTRSLSRAGVTGRRTFESTRGGPYSTAQRDPSRSRERAFGRLANAESFYTFWKSWVNMTPNG